MIFIISLREHKMKFKDFYLTEMAKPKDEHRGLWYHGTNKEGYEGIKSEGYLIPRKDITEKLKSMMAPQYNKVYMTANIQEAIGYAFLRSEKDKESNGQKYGYLVVIDGKELEDIHPDEDIIADIIPLHVNKFNNSWLRNLAKQKAPKSLEKYDKYGDYAYGTALGKLLIKYLTDEQKYTLIEYGKKIAHTGGVKVKEIWKLSLTKFDLEKEAGTDLTNYKNFGHIVWERK